MGQVQRTYVVRAASPLEAMEVWVDTDRWVSWLDGFIELETRSEGWPGVGGRVRWRTTPAGRGHVEERVEHYLAGVGMTVLFDDDRSRGQQHVSFSFAEGGDGVVVHLRQEYEIKGGGPFGKLTDYLFVRSAVGASLDRTLSYFAREVAHPTLDWSE
jgi:hypothetical protein